MIILPNFVDSFKKNRIRSHFFDYEREIEEEKEEEKKEIQGMTYIQMKLPIKKITPEFENRLKEEVEHNGLSVIIAARECIQQARKKRSQAQ